MKCPSCGAEISEASKVCQYCGTHITSDMRKEQEAINKAGCPKCGSSNITFTRENQGEIRGKNSKQVIHRTVGYCKDCGFTWYPDGDNAQPRKRKTWLWVLGWLLMFPLPLTVLLLRKKNIKPVLKYGIIAVAWILYLIIGLSGTGNNETTSSTIPNNSSDPTAVVDSSVNTDIELIAGEFGKYGKELVMSQGTDAEEILIVYYVPAGKYVVKNVGDTTTQVTVYEGITKNDKGYDEYTDAGDVVLIKANESAEIEVPDGWFIEIHEPTHIVLSNKE